MQVLLWHFILLSQRAYLFRQNVLHIVVSASILTQTDKLSSPQYFWPCEVEAQGVCLYVWQSNSRSYYVCTLNENMTIVYPVLSKQNMNMCTTCKSSMHNLQVVYQYDVHMTLRHLNVHISQRRYSNMHHVLTKWINMYHKKMFLSCIFLLIWKESKWILQGWYQKTCFVDMSIVS